MYMEEYNPVFPMLLRKTVICTSNTARVGTVHSYALNTLIFQKQMWKILETTAA